MIGAFANAGYSFVFIGEKHLFMKLLIAGATGLVGRHVLEKALHDERVRAVIAPGQAFIRNCFRLSSISIIFWPVKAGGRLMPSSVHWAQR